MQEGATRKATACSTRQATVGSDSQQIWVQLLCQQANNWISLQLGIVMLAHLVDD